MENKTNRAQDADLETGIETETEIETESDLIS